LRQKAEKLLIEKQQESCEITLSTNSNLPIHAYLTGIVSENIFECFITVTDITRQKLAEKAMIENQRLGTIGEMASSVAHDFNNSLQSIYENLELAMLSPELSTSTLKYLKTIKTAVSDIGDRIKLLQRFGDTKQDQNHFSFVNLNALIDEVIVQSRPLWKDDAEKQGLSIDIETVYNKIPEVFGNAGELRTVLFNIIKNSIEAMSKGGKIPIKTEERPGNVCTTITDTGNGMDEKTRARVFQPFYSTKGFDTGRGLGMSGVLSIIKGHGGDVYVKDTAPEKGTSIEILLPFTHKEEENKKELIEENAIKHDSAVHILWVEDDIAISKFVSEMLKILGHRGDIANSGKEALELLEQNTYDLVITDIGMPEMSGWQLADIIKEKFEGKMKVAVISGWDLEPSEAKRNEHGVAHYLGKPFSTSQLQKFLGEIVHN
jgi:signal transduction histidine kinase/CheY-like chemotaxis protein